MLKKIVSMGSLGAMLVAFSSVQAQSRGDAMLPDDIDSESLSRLPALSRDQLDDEGKAAYDMIVGDGPKPTTGPAAVSMYSPKVAEAWHHLNQYLRREGVLEPRYYEVAIIVAAWEIEQQYEYSAHEPAALRYGAPQAVIDTVREDREPEGLSREDTTIIRVGRQLMREHELDSALFAEAVDIFGEQGFVELVTIMGDYVMVGMVLTAIDQHLPADRPPRLPER